MGFLPQRSFLEKYFRNKKVLIVGLGVQGGGTGVAKFLARCRARLTITDLRSKTELRKSIRELKGIPAVYVLGEHRKEDFRAADLIIKSPAVSWSSPYLVFARSHHIPIDTDIGIFFELCRSPSIGVTGTKGKSTTATLIHRFLQSNNKKFRVFLAGNIGTSVLEVLPRITSRSYVVLELSSWQLEGMARHRKSPEIAVLTNILPDHLNRYSSFSSYQRAKELIFAYQKPGDLTVVNFDNDYTRALVSRIKSRIMLYSRLPQFLKRVQSPKTRNKVQVGAFVEKGIVFFGEERRPVISTDHIKLNGSHNLENVLAAVSVAAYLGIPLSSVRKVLTRFSGLPHRLECISSKNGISWYNDTAATMPDAVLCALNTLKPRYRRLILIAGGEDKGLDYSKLGKRIPRFVSSCILLPGSASEKLKGVITKHHKRFITRCLVEVSSIEEAVKIARKGARKGDAVLLSPGAASFNLFANEFERGRRFKKAVALLR